MMFGIQWTRRCHHLKSLGIGITMRSLVLLGPVSCRFHPHHCLRVASLVTHEAALCRKTKTPIGKERGTARGINEKASKVSLPEHLMTKNVITLSCKSTAEGGSCNVWVVGVQHDTQESCQQVQAVVSYLEPQAVFLELCSRREDLLKPQNKVPTGYEMIKMWKNNQIDTLHLLIMWFNAKRSRELGVLPGAEFRVACEEAMKYGGKVILGDRPSHITSQRAWGNTSFWHKAKFMFLCLQGRLHIGKKENNEPNAKLNEFHAIVKAIIDERDWYMSYKLLEAAKEHKAVVAVVGESHLHGIKKYWKQPIEPDLLEMPSQEQTILADQIFKAMGVVVASSAIVTVIAGIYLAEKR